MQHDLSWQGAPKPDTCEMLLVRHGATLYNEADPPVLQGRGLNSELSPQGVAQAHATSAFLRDVKLDAIYTSRLTRARQTADLVRGDRSIEPISFAEIEEIHVGELEGRKRTDYRDHYPEHFQRFEEDPECCGYPAGECYADVAARAMPVMRKWLAEHAGQRVLVVSHGMAIRIMLASLIGLPLRFARKLHQANCCINAIRARGEQVEVLTINSTSHLFGKAPIVE
jgi:broad specificity phosphatase PhoE